MKVLFAGSSLHGSQIDLRGLDVRPPAKRGDLLKAVREGAEAVGLIDGEFGQNAVVQHKEILFALDRGVAVFGSSSMGALRAAECASFGMIPIGVIASAYLDGSLDDDAAVALLMAPAELGSFPMSEPLVDAEATLEKLRVLCIIDEVDHCRLIARARALHFSDRTDDALFANSEIGLLERYRIHHISQKQLDAELLVKTIRTFHPQKGRQGPTFTLADSPYWRSEFREAGLSLP
ncbi:MAG: TfuA-like protein [Devosia sp.]